MLLYTCRWQVQRVRCGDVARVWHEDCISRASPREQRIGRHRHGPTTAIPTNPRPVCGPRPIQGNTAGRTVHRPARAAKLRQTGKVSVNRCLLPSPCLTHDPFLSDMHTPDAAPKQGYCCIMPYRKGPAGRCHRRHSHGYMPSSRILQVLPKISPVVSSGHFKSRNLRNEGNNRASYRHGEGKRAGTGQKGG